MSLVLLTGATGFIGGHVAQALLSRSYEVRALVRPQSTLALQAPGLSVAPGDIRDPGSVAAAMEGCDAVVHTAALYTLWTADPAEVYEVNVGGTRNVLRAAVAAGVQQVVYTSTMSTVSLRTDGVPADESQLARPEELAGHYKRSKFQAERIARRMAAQGLPVVIVNPTAPVGPGDVRPTPTGKVIVDFLRRAFPAYVDTGLNLVDVADVAEGHVLALERGTPGERYVLGNAEGNVTLVEQLRMLAEITGLPAPSLRIPHGVALAAAYADALIEGKLLRRPPRVPLEGARMARKHMWADPSKAIRELGLPQHSVRDALKRAVDWFTANGYAPPLPKGSHVNPPHADTRAPASAGSPSGREETAP